MRWWRRKEREQDLERELRADLELEAAELRESGLSDEEARYAARKSLGNATLIQEDVRAVWGWVLVEQIWRDIQYGGRTLRKSPAFTIATVLTLAIGISSNSAIFSVVNGVLLRPLAFDRSDELVEIYARDSQGQKQFVSQADLDDWRPMSHSFRGLASWVGQSVNLTGLDQPERITGLFVSSNFLTLLGVEPAIGRGFAAGEDRIGGERVAIISDRLWRSRFATDLAVSGKTVELNGEPFTIIGVLPASFIFPVVDADVYLPAFKYPNYSLDRRQTSCAVIARLRAGAPVERGTEGDECSRRSPGGFLSGFEQRPRRDGGLVPR